MKQYVALMLLATAASNVFAWGPREQAALAGFVGGYVLGVNQYPRYPHYNSPPPVYHPPQYVSPPVYYVVPPRQYQRCWTEYIYNNWNQLVAQRIVCN